MLFLHRGIAAGGIAMLTFVVGFASSANAFSIPNEPPRNLADVKADISSIEGALSGAQCGGWSTGPDETPLPQMISIVQGAPGRDVDIFGNFDSGMAAKQPYTFPSNAEGKTTVCDTRKSSETKQVYREGDAPDTRNRTMDVQYPYYEDPYVCSWPSKVPSALTPQLCGNFCSWLNENKWQYEDCKPDDVKPTLTGWTCTKWSKRWTCSDDWVDTGVPNCKQQCIGEACRCPGPGCEKSPANNKNYQSFYRKYTVTTSRMTLGKKNTDPRDLFTSIQSGAHCYDFYDESDPEGQISPQRCVIDETILADGSRLESIERVKEINKQRGQYLTQSPVDPPAAPNATRDAAITYNPKTDYWFPDIGNAFSLLSSFAGKNLNTAILSVDQARVTATVQRSTAEPFARGSMIRAFDDTVTNARGATRTFTEWWQRFQTDAHRLVTPPTVQLRLPYLWNKSIADLKPVTVSRANDAKDPRLASIDVQLAASDDMPGIIASYLKQSLLLKVEEAEVPVVVPLSSPVELRAYAQRWEEWKKRRETEGRTVPSEVNALITSLKDYADRIEKVRELRATLPIMLSKVISYQRQQALAIADWEKKNIDAYKAFQEQAKKRLVLEKKWREVQALYLDTMENTVTPWCKNDRYTAPIYSLLDGWLPSRPDINMGIPTCTYDARENNLPILCLPYQDRNFLFDFSLLKTSTGSIKIPVLSPVQVRLNIPTPGDVAEDLTPEELRTLRLPALPTLPDFTANFESSLPVIKVESIPPVMPSPADSQNLSQLSLALDQARNIIRSKGDTYSRFWNSIPYSDATAPQCEGNDMAASDCCSFGNGRCVQVETDLLERFMRLTARPGVLVKEDLQNQGIWRVPHIDSTYPDGVNPMVNATCWAGDHVCQSLLPDRSSARDGWQAIFNSANSLNTFIQNIRDTSRRYTLTDEGKFVDSISPYNVTPQEVYPVYDTPGDTTLSPVTP